MRRLWTHEENDYLVDHLATDKILDLCARFGRDWKAIYGHAYRLKQAGRFEGRVWPFTYRSGLRQRPPRSRHGLKIPSEGWIIDRYGVAPGSARPIILKTYWLIKDGRQWLSETPDQTAARLTKDLNISEITLKKYSAEIRYAIRALREFNGLVETP